jgi:3-dehydroquinate synthase
LVKLSVNLKERTYPIYITTGFHELGKACANTNKFSKIMVITDSNVGKHYSEECVKAFSDTGAEVFCYTIPAGEQSKILSTVSDIYREMIAHRLERSSALAALGGGVVGDITGFAAATYMRGIPFIQIPTTILAQADSSVGGKTGVDFEGSKNMVGAFHQPRFVYINVNTLKTLPEREIKSGLAEVIKHGLILDSEFFDYLEGNIDKILSLDEDVLQYIAKKNCNIKGKVVEKDEREGDLRAILNFGHTIGHAVESVSNFSMLHGECVSIGIVGAYKLAVKLGAVDEKTALRVEATLKKAGLPVKAGIMDPNEILAMMNSDKKIKDGKLNFILPKGIGEVIQCTIDNEDTIREVLEDLITR